jgi:hypothetical protein
MNAGSPPENPAMELISWLKAKHLASLRVGLPQEFRQSRWGVGVKIPLMPKVGFGLFIRLCRRNT